jgi:hypothetical protein
MTLSLTNWAHGVFSLRVVSVIHSWEGQGWVPEDFGLAILDFSLQQKAVNCTVHPHSDAPR